MSNGAFDSQQLREEARKVYRVPGFTGFPKVSEGKGMALDLGMNVGAFGLTYAREFDRVVAVDASSRCIRAAIGHFAQAGIENVEILHRALSARSGQSTALRRVYVGDAYESKDFSTIKISNDALAETDYSGRFREVEEIAVSIDWDDLLAESDAPSHVAFVKCDIEGAEYDLFHLADLSMVNCLALEVHYTFLGREKTTELLDHIGRTHQVLGFKAAARLASGEWPPPSILWFVNRRLSAQKTFALRCIASLRSFG